VEKLHGEVNALEVAAFDGQVSAVWSRRCRARRRQTP
jgi:hypothetical protein